MVEEEVTLRAGKVVQRKTLDDFSPDETALILEPSPRGMPGASIAENIQRPDEATKESVLSRPFPLLDSVVLRGADELTQHHVGEMIGNSNDSKTLRQHYDRGQKQPERTLRPRRRRFDTF